MKKDTLYKQISASQTNFSKKLEQQGYKLLHIEPIIYQNQEIGSVIIFEKKKRIPRGNHKQNHNQQIIGESTVMKDILHKCSQLASVNTPILLSGETGTGKELLAKYLHENSPRKDKPFIAINCGAISKELIGSELFGYEGGTFTGGKKEGKKGKFEEANGGTIFLDEIGEMPLELQVYLLRVLQEKEITRLGSAKNIKIDVRVIAATNRDLSIMVEEGLFRQDLFFQLNVVSLMLSSLKDRQEDIIPIANFYLDKFAHKHNKMFTYHLDKKVETLFLNYHWPGNIRELRNTIEHAVIFSNNGMVEIVHLPEYLQSNFKKESFEEEQSNMAPLEKAEMEEIKKLLVQTNWNKTAVSKKLNIARSTLYRKLKKYNIKEPFKTSTI